MTTSIATICSLATAIGQSGIGIVRVSGPLALDIAKKIRILTGADIKITRSNDQRSYRQDSSKLLKTGFKQKFSVEDAISEVKDWHKFQRNLNFNKFYTVKWMKKLGL